VNNPTPFLNFARFMRDLGCKIVIARRFDESYGFKEFLEFANMSELDRLDFIRGSILKDVFDNKTVKKATVFVESVEREELVEILKANLSEEELKGVDFDTIYEKSAGIPILAICMVKMGYDVEVGMGMFMITSTQKLQMRF